MMSRDRPPAAIQHRTPLEPENPIPLVSDSPQSGGVVHYLRLADDKDDQALVRALRADDPRAPAALFDRHGEHVTRVVLRIIGNHADVAELVNEAMLRAIQRIELLEDAPLLRSWLSSIAVNVSREYIRSRARRRWVRFLGWEDAPDTQAPAPDDDAADALREVYRALDRLGIEDRIVFAMRYINSMDLVDVAAALGVSLATIKRRLAKAEKRFVALARTNEVLLELMQGGARWKSS
jgi:RNA polymerase sigma-70 factor, ECF subfamily